MKNPSSFIATKSMQSGLCLVMVLGLIACAPYQIHKNKNTPQLLKEHCLIAILPIEVSIAGGYRPKDLDINDFRKQLNDKGYELQAILYNCFQQKGCSARILSIESTNNLLQQAGITPDKIVRLPKEELCRQLGVDAVVTGRTLTQQRQKNVSAASNVVLLSTTGFFVVGSVKSTDTNFDLRIYDSNHPEALWRCTAVLKDSEKIQQFVTQKLAKTLPYANTEKDKKQ